MPTNVPAAPGKLPPGHEALPDLALTIQPTTTVTHLRVRVAMLSDPTRPPPSPPVFQVLGWRKLHFDDSHKWSNEVQVKEVRLTPAEGAIRLDFEFSQPAGAGVYAYLCSVDPDYRVAEYNEGNNWVRYPAGTAFLRWS